MMGRVWLGGRVAAVAVGVLTSVGCGDGSAQFTFRQTGGLGQVRSFVAVTSAPEVIAIAREELARPMSARSLFIQGPVTEGDGGFNDGWDWHFVPDKWALVRESPDICDADPEFIDSTLQDWVQKIGYYCPRTARLKEEC